MEFNKRNLRVWSMLGMRRIVGQMLQEMAQWDKFIFMTADVARYFGAESFAQKYPEQIIDVGIAEQNLVGVAAGMVKEGMNVFAASYAPFLTARALDFVRVNMGYMKLGVKLIGVGGGLAESDLSPTHMGLEDIANMTVIPNITVISPCDGAELIKVLRALKNYHQPVYLQLTGKTNLPMIYQEDFSYQIGKANVLKDGQDIAIIASGVVVQAALLAAERLEKAGYRTAVIDMHTIKPLDKETINRYLSVKVIVSVQEQMEGSGMSALLAAHLLQQPQSPAFLDIGVKDFYPLSAEYEEALLACGLNEEGIYQKIKDFWEERNLG